MRVPAYLTLFFVLTSLSTSLGEHQIANPETLTESNKKVSMKSSLLQVGLTGVVVPQHGFRIDKIASKSLGNQLGLDKGDLLLRVNGIRIRTVEDMKKAMSLMKSTFIICVKDVNGRGIYRLKGNLKSLKSNNIEAHPKTSLKIDSSKLRSVTR